jgi:hypothetical protein
MASRSTLRLSFSTSLFFLLTLASGLASAQTLRIDLAGKQDAVVEQSAIILGNGLAAFEADGFDVQVEGRPPEHFVSWSAMRLAGLTVDTEVTATRPNLLHVEWTVRAPATLRLLQIAAKLNFEPQNSYTWKAARTDFHWTPQIYQPAATEGGQVDQVAADHIFRSPATILTAGRSGVALIPDLDELAADRPVSSFLDLRFPEGAAPYARYGFEATAPQAHRYYGPTGKTFSLRNGQLRFGCFVLLFHDSTAQQVMHTTAAFLWEHYSHKYEGSILPQTTRFAVSAGYAYPMALQHFWSEGPSPGTGGFTESTFFDEATQQWAGRGSRRDIWFQSWFNNMRTAYGLRYWGLQLGKPEWIEHAQQITRLLMQSPTDHGLFATVYRPSTRTWDTSSAGGGPGLYYLPDDAWTALYLLRYEQDFGSVAGADERLIALARTLIRLQAPDGGLPARVSVQTLAPDPVLDNTASEAMPLWFLAEMLRAGRFPKGEAAAAKHAVLLGAQHLRDHVLQTERFDDFELYFSCSPKPMNYFDTATQLHGESTLAMQWTAEALLAAYSLSANPDDLTGAEFALDILSMFQEVWNPPFIDLYAFGGFGVMNTDAEWNDARESQFSETYARFYAVTGNAQYMNRGIAALRASFVLMVMPENKLVAPKDYLGTKLRMEIQGGSAENYGHSGGDDRASQTGFDWGSGSALSGAAFYKVRYGDLFVDGSHKMAFGIDGSIVKNQSWTSEDARITTESLGDVHDIKIRSDSLTSMDVELDEQTH